MASRPQPASLRLGEGELTDPFGEEARIVYRLEFVEALHRIAPEVVADLADRLRPFVDSLAAKKGSVQPSLDPKAIPRDVAEFLVEARRLQESAFGALTEPVTVVLLPDGTAIADFPEFISTHFSPDVNAAFLAWARRWNFGNDHTSWLVQTANTTLYIWMKQTLTGEGPDDRLHPGPYVEYADRGRYSAEEARLLIESASHNRSFSLPDQEWNFRVEPKADAYYRIMETVRRMVKEELARIEAEALSRGDRPVIVKPAARDHLEWLIRYQVKGERYAAIARDVGRSRQAVILAVRQAATLIDLPLREPDRRGRPRKPTTPRIVKVQRKRSELHN